MQRNHRRSLLAIVCVVVALAVVSAGCGVVRPVRGRRTEAVHTGFLGDYAQLQEREGYRAQEVYVNPATDWSKYHAFHIDSVTLWVNAGTKLSDEDQQMLTDMLYKSLNDKLGERFEIVDEPAAGVIRLRFALTEAKGANVPMNAITTIIPQARLLSTVVGLGTDTAALVGSASVEGEAQDSITAERLGAVVDSRAGTKGVTRAFSKWADVQAICDYWAERVTDFFVRQGVRGKA